MVFSKWLKGIAGRILNNRKRTYSTARRGSIRGNFFATRTASWMVSPSRPGHSPEFGEVAELLEERALLTAPVITAGGTV